MDQFDDQLDLDEIRELIGFEPNHPSEPETEKKESDNTDTSDKKDVKTTEEKGTVQKNIVLYLHDLSYLIAVIVMVFLLFFRIVIVSGDSMFDTLVDGDYLLLVSNMFYHQPEFGDIIVVSKASYDDGTPIVKRVIATEGQIVDIDFVSGTVYVDGVALEEDYIHSPTTLYEGVSFPLEVEEGCVFVLGDNRNRSKDSRSPEIGLIDTRQIVGKAIWLVFPGSDHGRVSPQLDRIGVIG